MGISKHPLLPPVPSSSSSASSRFFIPAPGEPIFHPYSSLGLGAQGGLISGGIGLAVSAMQNVMQRHNYGALGVFTRTGGTITTFAVMGFSYTFSQAISANIREIDDPINGAIGGCAAGFVGGLRRGSLPLAVGTCAFLGTVIYTAEANGMNLTGSDPAQMSIEQKNDRRSRFWQPRHDKPIPEDSAYVAPAPAPAS